MLGWKKQKIWLAKWSVSLSVVACLLQYIPAVTQAAPSSSSSFALSSRAGKHLSVKAQVLFEYGLALFQKRRFDEAIAALEQAQKYDSNHTLRFYLARAHIRQGNQEGLLGFAEKQRQHYKTALTLDPSLLENRQFTRKYVTLQNDASSRLSDILVKKKRRPFKQREWSFGVGMTLGVEGLLGIQVGMLFAGMVNPLLTFSPVLQTLDLTLRIIMLRSFSWSPYVAAGVVLSLSPKEKESLFLAQSPILHATLGVHYVAPIGLTFAAGLSFVYDLTPNIDTTFLLIPSVQLSWYI